MRHGYTNHTELRDGAVRKTYDGPHALDRCAVELRALTQLRDSIPVPSVISNEPNIVTTEFIAGDHGQDLIDTGHAAEVLTACGALLRRLHDLDPQLLVAGAHEGVIRHGDFGPNNVLFDPDSHTVTALLDWEFSGIGLAIDDVAWCEWTVRMHHPGAVPALANFFDAYGSTSPWAARQDAMLRRCEFFEDFCRQWHPDGAGVRQWRARTKTTSTWLGS